jgi:hypothetical protein
VVVAEALVVAPEDEVPVPEVVVSLVELLHARASAPRATRRAEVDREVITVAWNEFRFLVKPERGIPDGLSNRLLAKNDRPE